MNKEMEKRIFQTDFVIREEPDGEEKRQVIEGYAATFNEPYDICGWFDEIIAPGAFRNAINGSDPRGLINHDRNLILGRKSSGTLELLEDEKGLKYRIYPPDTSYAKDLLVSMGRGDIKESSFGFTVEKEEWKEEKGLKAVRTITEIGLLYDVSPVTFPANPTTEAEVSKRALERAKNETENMPVQSIDRLKRNLELKYKEV